MFVLYNVRVYQCKFVEQILLRKVLKARFCVRLSSLIIAHLEKAGDIVFGCVRVSMYLCIVMNSRVNTVEQYQSNFIDSCNTFSENQKLCLMFTLYI